MLRSPRLEYHMNNIGIDQSLKNKPSVDQNFLNNIKKIYQHAGKCDDQQRLRDVLDADMVTNPEEITYVSPSLCITQTTVKKPSAGKSLCLFTNIFDVKKRSAIRHVESEKSKLRAIKVGISLWTNKAKPKGHSKINDEIKRNIYTCITFHPQVVQ